MIVETVQEITNLVRGMNSTMKNVTTMMSILNNENKELDDRLTKVEASLFTMWKEHQKIKSKLFVNEHTYKE